MKFETNQNVTNDKNIQDVSIFGLDLIPEGNVYILGKTWICVPLKQANSVSMPFPHIETQSHPSWEISEQDWSQAKVVAVKAE